MGSAGDSLSEAGKLGAIGAFIGAAAGGTMGSVVGYPIAGAAIGGGLGLSAGVGFGGQFKRTAFRFSPALSSSSTEANGSTLTSVKSPNDRLIQPYTSRLQGGTP